MLVDVLNNSKVFEGAHPSQVSEYVNQHVGRHSIEMNAGSDRKGRSSARLSFREFADIGLSLISYGDEVKVRCPDLSEVYHFQVVTRGQCCWRYDDDQRLLLRPGQALMMNPKEQIDLSYSHDCEKVIIKVPEEILRGVCLEQNGMLPRDGIRFERRIVDLQNTGCFMRFLDALLAEANEAEVELGSLQLSYREILINKLLHQFASNAQEQSSGCALDRSFSELIAYIDAHIKDEIDVDELAQSANVSVRTIYNQFSRHFGLTPRLYVKNAKLKGLREELIGNPRIRNVTEAALDYGFTHLGRFSSDYRKMFGELPSETFKRRR
ncbi:AraC family transcriptional regulator [Marinobacterium sp. D7]|uniref:AraC family transcriptional regulator n=1 Tax=Marinobacterium ramblicola TaxID=2849041 RepID=UPI001C2DAE62|nr:AraC family transcriptional regulator [Marinobacterium ramblicola]MBV1789138.1 AraC family transcriptional regulator [Marinobacterium ramblicola]